MLPVFAISFREFLEAFLSIGILLGISKKFTLRRSKGIILGASVGFLIVFVLATVVFAADSMAMKYLPKTSFDLIEGWLFVLSGIFVAYAVFSLHKILSYYSREKIKGMKVKIEQFKTSYWLLPFTAFLFVIKEGSEGFFFNAANGLFYKFNDALTGFALAFLAALTCGFALQKLFANLSIKRIFKISEVFIIFVGGNALTEGLVNLGNYYFHFDISSFDLFIMLIYIIFIYEVFLKD